MTKDVVIVNPDTPLKEAAQKASRFSHAYSSGLDADGSNPQMKSNDTGFFPVGENDRLVGTVTDRDIVIYAVAEGKDYKWVWGLGGRSWRRITD